MRLKSLTNDQTVPRYRYFNFYKPHKVDGKGFSSQMPTLKIVPSDQKSKRRTCAEECQMPFNISILFVFLASSINPMIYIWRMNVIRTGVKVCVQKIICMAESN